MTIRIAAPVGLDPRESDGHKSIKQKQKQIKAKQTNMDPAELLKSKQNVFITGGAGVGKTFTTRKIIKELSATHKIIQCGTTGVSVLQLDNGMTVHSAFKMPVMDVPSFREWVDDTKRIRSMQNRVYFKLLVDRAKSADILLIDEVSMCSAWIFELLDIRLRIWRERNEPMGGLTLLMVGDFLQLAPVYNHNANPPPHRRSGMYVFESYLWRELNIQTISLTKIYRQLDPKFAEMCNLLRYGKKLSYPQMTELRALTQKKVPKDAVQIMIRRVEVYNHNNAEMDRLTTKKVEIPFPMSKYGSEHNMLNALLSDARQSLYIQRSRNEVQTFSIGARVMLITNKKDLPTMYVNGDRGTVVGFIPCTPNNNTRLGIEEFVLEKHNDLLSEDGTYPVVEFDRTGKSIIVYPHQYDRSISQSGDNEKKVGIKVIPLCLAWASTVQKVQGATISGNVHINCSMMNFIPATFYVAISRATEMGNVTFSKFKAVGPAEPRATRYYDGTYVMRGGEIGKDLHTAMAKILNSSTEYNHSIILKRCLSEFEDNPNNMRVLDEIIECCNHLKKPKL